MSATDANTKEQLVKNVKAWIQMDNEIKEFQKEIKVRFNWCQKFCLFYVFVSVTYSNYIFYNEFYLFFFFFPPPDTAPVDAPDAPSDAVKVLD